MGIFGGKSSKKSAQDDADAATQEIFNEQYRQELRELGRARFKELIDDSAQGLRGDIDATMKHVADDLKQYMSRQVDVMLSGVNTEIANQLSERISEYNRLATEAQESANQSLVRSSQEIHEKYQQLSAHLQETITNQSVMMGQVFQGNKDRLALSEEEQKKTLETVHQSAEAARHASEKIYHTMSQTANDQAEKLSKVYQENLERVASAGEAHQTAIQTLQASTQALQKQYEQMSEFLETSVAQQKTMMTEAINENMAQIVEHYIVETLGEKSELRSQLPAIMEGMEENKQAMKDDMKL